MTELTCSLVVLIVLFMVSMNACIPGVKEVAEQYCDERATVSIDAIVQIPNGPIYAFSKDLYVQIHSITANGYPAISDESPNMIKKFWGKMPNHIDTGFVFANKVYFLKNKILWKHDPQSTIGSRVDPMDPEKEFAFFNGRSDRYENILSVSTEPNPNKNESQPIFFIGFMSLIGNDTRHYFKLITIEGNTTKEIADPKQILIDQSTNDLIFMENLVIDHWKSANEIVLKSLRFLKSIYLNYIYVKNNNEFLQKNEFSPKVWYLMMGYNQVWLGCPQPMCLDSTVDTIVMLDNKPFPYPNSLVFRGRFYWNITKWKPPLTTYAKLISEGYNGLPSYLDASYYDNELNEIFFFKNEFMYSKIGKNWVPKLINDIFPGIPSHINAVLFIDKKERLFFFKDDNYYIFEVQANQVSTTGKISEFPGLPNYIDEVLVYNDKVFVFKNWYYYQIEIQNFKGAFMRESVLTTPDPTQMFTNLFYCPKSVYLKTDFKTVDEYIENYKVYTKPIPANESEIPDKNADYTSTTTIEDSKNSIYVNTSETITSETTETDANSSVKSSGADDGEQESNSDKDSNNWVIYIMFMTVIISVIVFTVIGFTMFGNSQKHNKKKKDKNKLKAKKTNEKIVRSVGKPETKLNKIERPTKQWPENENKNAKKDQLSGINQEFTVMFNNEDDKDDNDIDKNEDTNPQPVVRVSTEQFDITSHPSLQPQEKPLNNNLFKRNIIPISRETIRSFEESKSDSI